MIRDVAGEQRETASHILLVLGVNIGGLADVIDDRDAGAASAVAFT